MIYDIGRSLEIEVLNFAIEPEHIHLFVNCPPDIAASQVMHRIKVHLPDDQACAKPISISANE